MLTVAVLISVSAFVVLNIAETDCTSAQFGDSGRCGDDLTYSLSDGTLLISGKGGMYDYFEDSSPWMKYCGSVTKVVIEDGVTSLGEWAFHGCVYIRELTIPGSLNSVKSNAHAAFAGCVNIEKVNITYGTNGSVCDYEAYPVNDRWYQNTPWYQSRDTLKEIDFADGIKGIGSDAFRELNITSVVIPDSVTGLGNHTFYNCAKLTDLTYPVSLRPYCDEKYPAFHGCGAIQKVTFTNGNGVPFDYTKKSWGAIDTDLVPWGMNSGVAKTIIITDNVTKLGAGMFCSSSNIKELTIPISINILEPRAFFGPYDNLEKVTITKGNGTSPDYPDYCSDGSFRVAPWNQAPTLKTVVVKDGVTRVGNYAFTHFSTENLILPDTLASFGENAFHYCTIRNLTIPISLNATWLDRSSAFEGLSGLETVHFTPGSGYGFMYAADKGSNCWYEKTPWYQCKDSLREIIFDKGIVRIGSDAFHGLNLHFITIPDSVVTLSSHSFYQCMGLGELTAPITLDCVASAQYPAFENCILQAVNFTSGSDGHGFDYSEGYYPPWAYVNGSKVCNLKFDGDITYIGRETLHGFTFYGKSGEVLPNECNLCGKTFNGENGQLIELTYGTDSAPHTESLNRGSDPFSDGIRPS